MKDPRKRINDEFPRIVYNPKVVRSRMEHIEENYYGDHPELDMPDYRGAFVDIEQELERNGTIAHFGLEAHIEKGAIFDILDLHKISEPSSTTHPTEGYYRKPVSGKPVIMAFHGNAGLSSLQFLTLLSEAIENGYGIYCPEYNSYAAEPDVSGLSKNDGKNLEKSYEASAKNLEKDAERAAKFLEDQGIPHSDTIVYGQCLGSCPAIHLASKNSKDHAKRATDEYKGLIVDSPMASSKKLVEENITQMVESGNLTLPPLITPKTVAGMLSGKHRITNASKMQDVTIPATVIYSPNDKVVPSYHHQAVFDALPKSNKNTKLYKTPFEGHIAATIQETMDEINDLVHDRDKTKYKEKSWSIRELTDENAEQYIQNAFQDYQPYVQDLDEKQHEELNNFAVEFVENNIDGLKNAQNANGVPTWHNKFYKALDAKRIDIRFEKTMEHLHELPPTSITVDEFCDKYSVGDSFKNDLEFRVDDKFPEAPDQLREYIKDRVAEKLDKDHSWDIKNAGMFGEFHLFTKAIVHKVLQNIEQEIAELQEQKAKAPEPEPEKHEEPFYKYNDKEIALPETSTTIENVFAEYKGEYPKAVEQIHDTIDQTIRENFDDMGPRATEHVKNRFAEAFANKDGSDLEAFLFQLNDYPSMGKVSLNNEIDIEAPEIKEEINTLIEKQKEKEGPAPKKKEKKAEPEVNDQEKEAKAEEKEREKQAKEKVKSKAIARQIEKTTGKVLENEDIQLIFDTPEKQEELEEILFNNVASELKAQMADEGTSEHQFCNEKGHRVKGWKNQVNAIVQEELNNIVPPKQLSEKILEIVINQAADHVVDQARINLNSEESTELADMVYENLLIEVQAQSKNEGKSDITIINDAWERDPDWKENIQNLARQELVSIQERQLQESLKLDLTGIKDNPARKDPELKAAEKERATNEQIAKSVENALGNGPLNLSEEQRQEFGKQLTSQLIQEMNEQRIGKEADSPDTQVFKGNEHQVRNWRDNLDTLAQQQLHALEIKPLDLSKVKSPVQEQEPIVDKDNRPASPPPATEKGEEEAIVVAADIPVKLEIAETANSEVKPKTRINQIKEQLAQAGLKDGVSSQGQDKLANAVSALKMAASMEGNLVPNSERKEEVSKEMQPNLGEIAGQEIQHGEFVKKVAPEKYQGKDEVQTKTNETSTQIGKG